MEQQPILATKKRPRSTSEANAPAAAVPDAVLDPAPEAPPQVDPTTIFNNIPNAIHLASTKPKLTLPQTQIRNVMKKAAAGFSNRPDAVYLVSKAAECLLTEILTACLGRCPPDSKKFHRAEPKLFRMTTSTRGQNYRGQLQRGQLTVHNHSPKPELI